MKTYKTTTEKPRLVIKYDSHPFSPRVGIGTAGYFITCENNRHSPDKHTELEQIISETGNQAEDVEEHIKLIKNEYIGYIKYIYPVTRYEHGNIVYKLGKHSGFDYSVCGFYIITKEQAKEYKGYSENKIKDIIVDELELYNKYVNGEVYMFTLYDENGNKEDCGHDFYSIDDIKECLPAEWKKEDLQDYFIQ